MLKFLKIEKFKNNYNNIIQNKYRGVIMKKRIRFATIDDNEKYYLHMKHILRILLSLLSMNFPV